jgi:uncharacterized membrane protein YfhO
VSYAPESVELATRSPRPGYVLLADTFRPGWVAEVDGVESPVLRGEIVFRAAAVPAGEHSLRFLYRPASLRLGFGVSAISLGIVGLWFLVPRLRRRRPPEAPEEDEQAEESQA